MSLDEICQLYDCITAFSNQLYDCITAFSSQLNDCITAFSNQLHDSVTAFSNALIIDLSKIMEIVKLAKMQFTVRVAVCVIYITSSLIIYHYIVHL